MGYMSEIAISEHDISALIGPGFWQRGNMIGLDDYRDTRTVGRRLRVAMATLQAAGYHATMGFTKDRKYVLLVNRVATNGVS